MSFASSIQAWKSALAVNSFGALKILDWEKAFGIRTHIPLFISLEEKCDIKHVKLYESLWLTSHYKQSVAKLDILKRKLQIRKKRALPGSYSS